jgi:acyl-CoA synthetase (NDP forming)
VSARPPQTGLSALWDAGSVAVVGASDRADSLARLPLRYLREWGFGGRIVPVNPRLAEVDGLPCAPSLVEAAPIDLALVMVSAERVPEVMDDCAAAGVPVAIVTASGFAETGEEGRARQRELARRARQGGVRLVGPNCIGAVAFARGLAATFTPLLSSPDVPRLPGRIAFAGQSGALGFGTVSLALERGLGLGWAVSTGNEADVSALEALDGLLARPDCDGGLALLEGLPDPRWLRAAAGHGKPLGLLVTGTSGAGAAAAASHTGALAAPRRLLEGALRQLGVASADDVEGLLDLGDAFAQPRRPRGPRVAIVTTSGGSGIMAADAVEANGLELAPLGPETTARLAEIVPPFGSVANPVDVTAAVMSDPTLFTRCLADIAGDPAVDLLIACFCVLTAEDVEVLVERLAEVARTTGVPVLVAKTGADFLAPAAHSALRRAGVPAYPTPARAVAAAAGLWRTARTRPAPSARTAAAAPPPDEATEWELKLVLARAGIPVPDGRIAGSPEEAASAVADLGGRAVMKAVVPGLPHKTEVGGIAVGVGPSEAAGTWSRLAGLGGRVLVEEQVDGGVEMLVGVADGPLGRTIAVGAGGVFAEALDDVAFRLVPIGPADAAEMIDELRSVALLDGARGRPPADRRALADLLVRVSEVVAGWPPGLELDLNPVVALPGGVRVLDAMLTRDGAARAPGEGGG